MTITFTNRKTIASIIGIVTLMLAVVVILFTGTPSMSRESITTQLNEFADTVSKEVAATGKEGKFSYGDIDIKGWGFDKYAVVKNISLEIAEKTLLDTHKWSFSTQSMVISPDRAAPMQLNFMFPESINIIENGDLQAIASFDTPLKYGYFNGKQQGTATIIHSLLFPSKISLKPGQNASPEESNQQTVTITYDANPTFLIRDQPERGLHESDYEFKNITVASSDNTQVTIGSFTGSLREKNLEKDQVEGQYRLTINDLAFSHADGKAGTPYSFDTDINYTGDRPAMDAIALKPTLGSADVKINKMNLSGENFKVRAEGTLHTINDDPLPSGLINLDIDNPKGLLNSELMPEQARGMATTMLQRVSGPNAINEDTLHITLKREIKGVFYIGNVTFEELTAAVLGDLLKVMPQHPVTQPPAASSPASPEAPASDSMNASPDASSPAQDSSTPEKEAE